MNKDFYENDLLHRYPGYSFVETTVGSMTLVEFQDGGSTTVAESEALVLVDAYMNIRNQMLEGQTFVSFISTTAERDALTGINNGVIILNDDTYEMECVDDGEWYKASGSYHIFEINTWFNMSGVSTKVFIPLAGSTSEDAVGDDQRIFIPSNLGKLLRLRVYSTNDLASTVFTLENGDGGSVIGTKTVTVGNSGIVEVDFTTGLDSGVNTFDGSNPIVISIDPTNTADQVSIAVVFEIDN